MTNKKIQKAIELVGTQTKLAEACGVSQPTVLKWLNGGGISAEYLQKSKLPETGQVTIREICEGWEMQQQK
ncbi:helix-turn-helix domain-containing protein [Mannheimia haemolytica]|nr:helix-turn-helix domain-containing protein [Mannheimia haemolytica]